MRFQSSWLLTPWMVMTTVPPERPMPMLKWATASAVGWTSCLLESVTTPFLPALKTHHALHPFSTAVP